MQLMRIRKLLFSLSYSTVRTLKVTRGT